MKIVHVDFTASRREREEFLIALGVAVQETVADDPVSVGPVTATDLLECEQLCRSEEAAITFNNYVFAVGALHTKPGENIRTDMHLDPECHARTLKWALGYLAEVNAAFGVMLGEDRVLSTTFCILAVVPA